MQTGFLLLEVGSVRAEHAKAICVKNACDFLVVTFAWLIFGYPFAFGSSGGFLGDLTSPECGAFGINCSGATWAGWFFQWSFASATCTIVSGAGAERCSFQGYIVSTLLLSTFVYPAVVHWVWASDGWLSSANVCEWVQLVDFAGAGVVHMTGGMGALAMSWTIGPRDGRFSKDGQVNALVSHNLVLAITGAMFLTTGWFAFNGGSTLQASAGGSTDAARICVVTAIGAAAGGITTLGGVWFRSSFIQLEALMNGLLAGLVSITAGPHCFTPGTAFLSGVLGGMVYMAASNMMLYCQIDDPLDAAPIHGACGAWGLLAVGLFANEGGVEGAFFGNAKQLQYQVIGILAIGMWSFGVMCTVFQIMMAYDKTTLRVPLDIELAGDIILYGGSAYPSFQAETAPPSGNLAVVVTDVQDSAQLWDWNEEVMAEAIDQHFDLLRQNILRFSGLEFMDEGDSLSIVFHNALEAVRFSLVSTEDLMAVPWHQDLLEHASAKREEIAAEGLMSEAELLYNGLRVRFVIEVGHANKTLNKETKRLTYDGDVVSNVKFFEKIVTNGGVVVSSTAVVQALQEKFARKLHELGPYVMQDLGTFKLPPNSDGDALPISLVQIMPTCLEQRPAAKINAERLGIGYADAPGVSDPDESVAIVFCTLSEDGGSGKGMEVAEGLMSANCHSNGGYVSKNSQGVCLLAFTSADDGMAFLLAMASQLTDHSTIQFTAGLHPGVASKIEANKASGRADYYGPPVNTSARLLALAGNSRDKFGRRNVACAVSRAAVDELSSSDSLESQGKFELKGVDEMEVFAVEPPTPFVANQAATAAAERRKALGLGRKAAPVRKRAQLPGAAPTETTEVKKFENNSTEANSRDSQGNSRHSGVGQDRSHQSGAESRRDADGNFTACDGTTQVDDDDPIYATACKAIKAYDMDDFAHIIIGKVCDFTNGAESPPAPRPTSYMERGLALMMADFQAQMAGEVCKAGGEDEGYMTMPEMCALWEMERFFPSSEDSELQVSDLKYLAVCRDTGKAAMVKMNVFVQGDICSGFTLDKVTKVPDKYITQMHDDKAQERYHTRRMNISAAEIFTGDYDFRFPFHIAASEGEVEGVKFLIKASKGDAAKWNCKDRWGGTPLGDAERGLDKNPPGSENHEAFAEVVKCLKEVNALSDARGKFETIDTPVDEAPEAGEIIQAAADGDLNTLVRMCAQGKDLYCWDYDSRTAMHLAACNGHMDVIEFLLSKMDNSEIVQKASTGLEDENVAISKINAKLAIINPLDRFYGTPLDDCVREGTMAIHAELTKWNDALKAELAALGANPSSNTSAVVKGVAAESGGIGTKEMSVEESLAAIQDGEE